PIEIGDADFCPVSGDGEWRCPTLKALGLTVPPALLTSADEVHHIDVALGPSFNSAIRLKPSFSYIPGAWKSWLVTQIRRTDMRNQLMPFLYDCGWQMT
ncbi:MAG: hypothetical protein WBE94_22455, partial [Pseudolabrys sp.]